MGMQVPVVSTFQENCHWTFGTAVVLSQCSKNKFWIMLLHSCSELFVHTLISVIQKLRMTRVFTWRNDFCEWYFHELFIEKWNVSRINVLYVIQRSFDLFIFSLQKHSITKTKWNLTKSRQPIFIAIALLYY